MSVRARLLADHCATVLQLDDSSRAAADELLDHVLDNLALHHSDAFTRDGDQVHRSDRQVITLDNADPLGTLVHLVQRLFDGAQSGWPLWRFNALWHDDATLHQPRRSDAKRVASDPVIAPYFRSEKQCIFRRPTTQPVVFSIHTFVLARADVAAF